MSVRQRGVLNQPVDETPVAIVDLETTGLSAGAHRVVEVSVIRIDPGQPPRLVLDTLVNPQRRVTATEIHGITDEDVADAPRFGDIAGHLVRSLYGCVLAAYNVYFDLPFLQYELSRVGLQSVVPHLCLMYLRPMIGLGPRCSLHDACCQHGIEHEHAHTAAADAQASARLWQVYLEALARRGVRTFGELKNLRSYKFVESLHHDPLAPPVGETLTAVNRFKSRSGWQPAGQPSANAEPPRPATAPQERASAGFASRQRSRSDTIHSYWEALKAVLCDLEVTDDEIAYLAAKQEEWGLSAEEIRALHARAFATVISQCIDDKLLDEGECTTLRRLYRCLQRLGYAPGQ